MMRMSSSWPFHFRPTPRGRERGTVDEGEGVERRLDGWGRGEGDREKCRGKRMGEGRGGGNVGGWVGKERKEMGM